MDSLAYWSFGGLSTAAAALIYCKSDGEDGTKDASQEERIKFRALQQKYFPAYFLALLGDWLQGPYVYQLYSHYGYSEGSIAILFLTGFASSGVFGTFTGPMADKYGRRKMALVFCVLYAACCLIKLMNNFWILFVGRILGGVSTSLLWSVFESWYVGAHQEQLKLPPTLISSTMSTSVTANSLLAILAGVCANWTAEAPLQMGPTAPFMLAVPCFAICFLVVFLCWEENYGDREAASLTGSYFEGLALMWRDRRVLLLGLVQSAVESCMYTFVFLWTPVLADESTPLGLVFSCFMVAIMIGGSIFSLLLKKGKTTRETLLYSVIAFLVGTTCSSVFAGPGSSLPLLPNKIVSFLSFLTLEAALGMYFPSAGSLRSRVIPESHRATVTNLYRVPMNLLTCASLIAVNHPDVAADKRVHFAACSLALLLGCIGAIVFRNLDQKSCINQEVKTK